MREHAAKAAIDDNRPMEVTPHCVVALTWQLKDTLGEELDVLAEPVEFLVGGSDLLQSVERALQGHAAGTRLDLHLEPEEAFGEYDEMLVFLEPRSAFPAELEEGMVFDASSLPAPQPGQPARPDTFYTATEIYPEHVVLDGNHPLAGIALRLSLKIESVREPTEEEARRGSTGSAFFKLAAEPEEDAHSDPAQQPAAPSSSRGLLH